ncbi:MAG: hypothetical protein ACLRR3_12485 [Eubacterium sp.]
MLVSRIFVWILYYMGFQAPIVLRKRKRQEKNINFVEKRKVFVLESLLFVIVIGIGGINL